MTAGLRFGHLFGRLPAPSAEGDPPAPGAPSDDAPADAAFEPCADCANPGQCRAAGACHLDTGDAPADDAPAGGEAEGGAEGGAAARRAERARIAAILAAPASAGRGECALHLALHTTLPARQAVALLGAAPAAAAPRDRLAAAMAAQPQPELGPGGDAGASKPGQLIEHMRRKYGRR